MQNLAGMAADAVREYTRAGSSQGIPAIIAAVVFLAAIRTIGKQVRLILTGK
jgi:hypothetical protein